MDNILSICNKVVTLIKDLVGVIGGNYTASATLVFIVLIGLSQYTIHQKDIVIANLNDNLHDEKTMCDSISLTTYRIYNEAQQRTVKERDSLQLELRYAKYKSR